MKKHWMLLGTLPILLAGLVVAGIAPVPPVPPVPEEEPCETITTSIDDAAPGEWAASRNVIVLTPDSPGYTAASSVTCPVSTCGFGGDCGLSVCSSCSWNDTGLTSCQIPGTAKTVSCPGGKTLHKRDCGCVSGCGNCPSPPCGVCDNCTDCGSQTVDYECR